MKLCINAISHLFSQFIKKCGLLNSTTNILCLLLLPYFYMVEIVKIVWRFQIHQQFLWVIELFTHDTLSFKNSDSFTSIHSSYMIHSNTFMCCLEKLDWSHFDFIWKYLYWPDKNHNWQHCQYCNFQIIQPIHQKMINSGTKPMTH